MVTKWLHLNELGGDPWVLPIWAAVHKAIASEKAATIPKESSELALHISTRLNLLPRIIGRLNSEVAALLDIAKAHNQEHVFSDGAPGKALSVDDDLKYKLIADIDAFLFEVNTCAELMGQFFQQLHGLASSPIADDKLTNALIGALTKFGVSRAWFKLLDRNRNFVAHEGTPYLAIDISDKAKWELLVMKENLVQFDDPKKFFRFEELRVIAAGFMDAKVALQRHLIELFHAL